jgi:hypothetical protein
MVEANQGKPDLTKGIPEDHLADDAMLVGQVGDEEVLLARRGRRSLRLAPPAPITAVRWAKDSSSTTRSAVLGITPASVCAPARRWLHRR